jgi:hypothetical protein
MVSDEYDHSMAKEFSGCVLGSIKGKMVWSATASQFQYTLPPQECPVLRLAYVSPNYTRWRASSTISSTKNY